MELRIEIEPGTDPIRGLLRTDPEGAAQEFVGWLNLVELIAAAAEIGELPAEPDGAG